MRSPASLPTHVHRTCLAAALVLSTPGIGLAQSNDNASAKLPVMQLNGEAGSPRGLNWLAEGSIRWAMQTNGKDDLCLYSFSDTGAFIGNPFCLGRSTGQNVISGLTLLTNTRDAPPDGQTLGELVSVRNTSPAHGGVAAQVQYVSAADSATFDVAHQIIAAFNPSAFRPETTSASENAGGPGQLAQFVMAISPNDSTHNWGTNVAEWNIVNRGRDIGWMRDRNLQPVTGGLLLVPETSVVGDPGGGAGTNSNFAFSLSRSANINTLTLNDSARFYNGFQCEPNSLVGVAQSSKGVRESYCLYATGDITGLAANIPYAPLGLEGTWLHGLSTTKATFQDGLAMRVAPGQSIGWVAGKATATVTAIADGDNLDLRLNAGGTGRVKAGPALQVGSTTAADATFYMNGAASSVRRLVFQTAANNRWQIGPTGDAEGARDTGADFAIYRFANDGKYLGNALKISRDTGLTSLSSGLTVANGLTADTLKVPGHLSGSGGAKPAASAGAVDPQSSDTRGAVTLPRNTVSTTITFATPFGTHPFCTLTGSDAAATTAVTSISATVLSIAVSANPAGETITWLCLQ